MVLSLLRPRKPLSVALNIVENTNLDNRDPVPFQEELETGQEKRVKLNGGSDGFCPDSIGPGCIKAVHLSGWNPSRHTTETSLMLITIDYRILLYYGKL
jgi:hypothetical protein